MSFFLHSVRHWGGRLTNVRVAHGQLEFDASPKTNDEFIDGRGDVLLPGLHDHHLHILAIAARQNSVDLAGALNEDSITQRLKDAPPGPIVRAVDYDERAAGLPDASKLDCWLSTRPLRVTDRTGALWVLNTSALALIQNHEPPPGAERDASGKCNGRFWREDRWLAKVLPRTEPDLTGLGAKFAQVGLCSLTDAGAHNGAAEAKMLVGRLPQHLTLMGSEALPSGAGYQLGPLKLLFDERALPAIDVVANRIKLAHDQRRNVAAHCVTEGELAFFLAALEASGGPMRGDRIEHGSMIPEQFISEIQKQKLIIVTNPAFIHDRGDKYYRSISEDNWPDLYRAHSLKRAGITLLGASDAPYANVDPWHAMRAARDRTTAAGQKIAPQEALTAIDALRLYSRGHLETGASADFILCEGSLADVLSDLDSKRVRMTVIRGIIEFSRNLIL